MSKETVSEFLERGGQITYLEPYDRAYNNTLLFCPCGCRGVVAVHDDKRIKNRKLKKPFEGTTKL